MPDVFSPPEEAIVDREAHTTYCQVFVGPHTAFECADGCRLPGDFSGVSNTVLVVEGSRAVPWTKPEDLVYLPDQPLPELGALRAKNATLFFNVTKSYCIAWGDGRVTHMLLEDQRSFEQPLRAAITRDGKEIGNWYWR
jgi:hypothetical protein